MEAQSSTVMLVLCGVGAFVLHNVLQTFDVDVVQFLPNYFPKWDTPASRILETIIFSVLGAFVAYYVVVPTTGSEAIIAGFGWTGFLKGAGEVTRKVKDGRKG